MPNYHVALSFAGEDRDYVDKVVWIYFKLRRCFRDFVTSISSQVVSFSA